MQHKKEAFNLIESICSINENQWNNPRGSYDDFNEASYQIEEALEGFPEVGNALGEIEAYSDTPKEVARSIVAAAMGAEHEDISNVDRVDKAVDAIYFAVGSLHKIGLLPQDIVDVISIVHNANIAKSGKKDSSGKVIKTNDFLEPEPKIQEILDKRGIIG